MAKYIYTNLRLPFEIISKHNGRNSIQINGLKGLLGKDSFSSMSKFASKYNIEYDRKKKQFINFKLFIIMDTDDCSEEAKQAYISGGMFDGHWAKDYIVPIYNINNLEDVMHKSGIMTKRIENKEKGNYYSRIFPINTDPPTKESMAQIKSFREKLSKVKETNMTELIDYCLSIAENL
ncbi:MAG: hypothetical protein K2K87_02720 [Lachnospiraceae bacterium]|nr:hypothetical protein [Lachnospiraceae bacterium]